MITKDMRKSEIEELLDDKGDFVKIDYLTRFLKTFPPIDMKKFAYLKLAKIYLDRKMFIDAANMYKNASINSLTFREKQDNYLKEAKCYIRAGKYEKVNNALKKAFAEANLREQQAMYKDIIEFYKQEGAALEYEKKENQASKLYEELIKMNVSKEEKEEIKEKLLKMYEHLGKTKEHSFLEKRNF